MEKEKEENVLVSLDEMLSENRNLTFGPNHQIIEKCGNVSPATDWHTDN